MAMLAEKRRKTKWILNPRSNQWSDDSSKFGQRLMEKMGWKAGNGLGINQQGETENVKVTVRSDNRGVGFKDRPEDILPHQDEFAELLLQLGNASNDAQAGSDAVETRETSLEAKSQRSRSRVHYHKFTRGKDLSRYSAKDLECILGKKSNETLTTPAVSTAIPESDVVTIVRGNMVDYFKDKKKNMGYSWPKAEGTESTADDEMEERPSFGFGFNPVLDKSHTVDEELEERPSFGFGFKPVLDKRGDDLEKDAVKEDPEEDGKVEKREKKRSKKIKNVEAVADNTALTEPVENDNVQSKMSKKEQKKSKKAAKFDEGVGDDLHNSTDICEKEKEDKKKAKNAEDVTIADENAVEDLQEAIDENKMEKKRKSKKINVGESLVEHQEIQDEDFQESTKSRKKEKKEKSKKTNVEDEGTVDELQDVSEVCEKKKKRKVKKESVESNGDDIVLESKEKKKKKGKMNETENTIPSNEILSDGIPTDVAPSEQTLSNKKKKKRKHDTMDTPELVSKDNDSANISCSKESTDYETEATPDKAEQKGKKSKKRKHAQDKEDNEAGAKPIKKRRKSVTFSEELFEVVLIPPREELTTDSDEEEEDDVGTSGDSATINATPDLIQIVDGKRYVNGILEVEGPIKPARIFKTDAAKRIKFEVRDDAFDSFPGSNVHMLGYAGLNIKQPRSVEYLPKL